jgi:DNA-binding ferritin-like protein
MREQKALQHIEVETVDSMMKKKQKLKSHQNIDESIPQYYEPDASEANQYMATLGAKAKVHFYNQSKGVDEKRELQLSIPIESRQKSIAWENATTVEEDFEKYPTAAPKKAEFSMLPGVVLEDKGLKRVIKELKETLYRKERLELLRCVKHKLESKPRETKSDFMVRLQDLLNEKKEIQIEKLKERYGKKEKTLLERLERAKERVEKESSDTTSSMIEAGIAVLGALFGRSTPTKIGRAVSKGGKILKERGDVSRAEERMLSVADDLEALEYELEDKVDLLNEEYSIESVKVETFALKPRKTDIDIEICAVVWRV